MRAMIAFREWFWAKPARPVFALAATSLLMLPAGQCQSVPVKDPCGVIRDSLASVRATDPGGQQRLDVHFERGRAAGCWGRV